MRSAISNRYYKSTVMCNIVDGLPEMIPKFSAMRPPV